MVVKHIRQVARRPYKPPQLLLRACCERQPPSVRRRWLFLCACVCVCVRVCVRVCGFVRV